MTTNDTDDLRRALAARDNEAPHGQGILDAVLTAAPRRRRARMLQTAAVTTAVIAAAITVPLLWNDGQPSGTASSGAATTFPASTPTSSAGALTVTASVASEGDYIYRIDSNGVVDGTQRMVIRPQLVNPSDSGGEVIVYAPGAFDPAPYAGGEAVDVNGRPGRFVANFAFPQEERRPTDSNPANVEPRVAWQLPDGSWVLYRSWYLNTPEATMHGVAALRFTAAP